jgi:hypothetical protein
MAFLKKSGFSGRGDNITDELIAVLASGTSYDFKDLFVAVHVNLKLRKAAGGGEEMLRLRCHEKLQRLIGQGFVQKTGKAYRSLQGIEQASSTHLLAKAQAAVAARVAAAS